MLYEAVLLFGVVMVAGLAYGLATNQRHALQGNTGLQAFLFIVLGVYFAGLWSTSGQTLAMKTWHIRVLAADGVLLGTTANFGYMSGALKHFFDTIFLEAGGALSDDGSAAAGATPSRGKRPWGLYVHGRYDTTGAVRSVESIVGALPWRQAAPVLEVLGEPDDVQLEAAYELGATLAALISGPGASQ